MTNTDVVSVPMVVELLALFDLENLRLDVLDRLTHLGTQAQLADREIPKGHQMLLGDTNDGGEKPCLSVPDGVGTSWARSCRLDRLCSFKHPTLAPRTRMQVVCANIRLNILVLLVLW